MTNEQQARPRSAIVAEGGGQRGIFTAGILDAFLEQNFNPFELAIGPSAGAQNLLSYWLGEYGYARRMIADLTTQPDFYVPYRWLLNRNVIDLDGYFSQVESNPEYQLPLNNFDSLTRKKPIVFVATNKQTAESVYLRPDSISLIEHLKASSAVPFLYRHAVNVNGVDLFDGGVADPVPVRAAHNMGANLIVVIRTVSEKSSESMWRPRLESALKKQTLHPHLANMLQTHETSYQQAIDFIQNPPEGTKVFEIAPSDTLISQTFGSSSDALISDYKQGYDVGTEVADDIQTWLSEKAQLPEFA